MYRGIIQHRIYLTTYLRKQIEARGLAEGLGMGRIYRVVPQDSSTRPASFNLLQETSTQLVARLGSPNGWIRDTAQRLLVECRDPASVTPLRTLTINPAASAIARLHALWTLEGLDGLDRPTLLAALDDRDATVCAAAIRLSERLLGTGDAEIFTKVVAAQSKPGVATPYQIILQQCLSLGESRDARTLPTLLDLARTHGSRPVIADTIVSGLAGREVEFITLAFAQPDPAASVAAVTLAATCVWRSGDTAPYRRARPTLRRS